jgi:NAD(P)-dependent dehydrogenase (short-subunit alcohol dehydrogenase family)
MTAGYEGKRVLVTGCYSGMGEATARALIDAGAEVHGFDIKHSTVPLTSFSEVDLRDPLAIDQAVDGLGGHLDCLFSCAGLPPTFPPVEIMKVNFIGSRHLAERVIPTMLNGGAITTIASTAGMGYGNRLPTVLEFIATPDFAAAVAWCEDHLDIVAEGYSFSKEAIIGWTMRCAVPLIKQGIRINCTSPGPTTTAMTPAFDEFVGKEFMAKFPRPIGRDATPEEQALPLLFLNSVDARFITGENINVDGGFVAGVTTDQITFDL